jgi:hypothetical protein
MRKRGRPPGPASSTEDAELVWRVRQARDRGLTVRQACEEIRKQRRRGPTSEQLERRYKRIATAYPDKIVDYEPSDPRLRLLMKIFGIKTKTRLSPGAFILSSSPIRKPSKY